jgi:hypothetical protein
MKRICFVQLLIVISGIAMADETISLLNNGVTFEIPDGVLDRRTSSKTSDFKNINEYSKYWGDKVFLRIDILTEEVFRVNYKPSDISPAVNELLRSNKQFNTKNLRDLLKGNKTFVFSVYSPDAFLIQSYLPIVYLNETIGETFFISNFHDLKAPVSYAFAFYIAVKDTIIQIAVSLNDYNDFIIPMSLPNYFVERNGAFYWKNREAVDYFFEKINSDLYRNLPAQLRLLREARDLILCTLKVRE